MKSCLGLLLTLFILVAFVATGLLLWFGSYATSFDKLY